MFSVTLALIAIFGIALTNLFLGFASALLIGRGPRSWSDVDEAVNFCSSKLRPCREFGKFGPCHYTSTSRLGS